MRRPASPGRGAVLVVGVGGLGAAAARELALGGAPRIGLADGDVVDVSNLHRQLLHGPGDLGRPKAEVARAALAALAPEATIVAYPEHVIAANAETLVAAHEVVLDATDDPPTKFLLNDVCVRAGRMLVHAGVVGLYGQLWTIVPGETACLRCLFPEPPPEGEAPACREAGILGPLAAWIGALQAREALKRLGSRAGIPECPEPEGGRLLAGRMLSIDVRRMRVREVPLRRSPACPVCGNRGGGGELRDGSGRRSA